MRLCGRRDPLCSKGGARRRCKQTGNMLWSAQSPTWIVGRQGCAAIELPRMTTRSPTTNPRTKSRTKTGYEDRLHKKSFQNRCSLVRKNLEIVHRGEYSLPYEEYSLPWKSGAFSAA